MDTAMERFQPLAPTAVPLECLRLYMSKAAICLTLSILVGVSQLTMLIYDAADVQGTDYNEIALLSLIVGISLSTLSVVYAIHEGIRHIIFMTVLSLCLNYILGISRICYEIKQLL